MYEMENGPKALREQLAWARRLATEMVADAGLAEDVVQDAWVQLLTRPPRRTESMKGWFAQVMRNLARQEWRQGKRREELELAQGCEELGEATSDLVARAQAQQALVEVVLGLDRPYRDIVLLRYFEDLESPAIAAKLGMPASSVRSRLQRGLALVRSKLEERHGPEARNWLGALLPLLPRPSVSKPAAGSAGTLSASSRPARWAVKAALSVGAIAAVVVLARPLGRSPEPIPVQGRAVSSGDPVPALSETATPPNASESSRTPTPREEVVDLRRADPEPSDSKDASAAPSAPAPSTLVEVRVDGVPATKGVVLLSEVTRWIDRDERWLEFDPGSGQVEALESPIGRDGQAVFEETSPLSGAVGLEPYGDAAVVQRNFSRRNVSEPIVLELGTARIDGRVWTSDGEPAMDVPVLLGMKIGHDYGALRGRCLSDAKGRFAFEGLPAASFWLHAEAPGHVGELRSHGELSRGEVRELQLGRPTGRVRWSGRLIDVVGNAIVFEPQAGHGLEFASLDGGGERSYFPADLSPDGSYSVDLVPGEYAVRRRSGEGSSAQLVEARIAVRDDEQRDLILRGARVMGTVHLAESGTPLDPDVDGQVILNLVREEQGAATTRYATRVSSEGSYAFDGVADGRWILEGQRLAEDAPVVVLLVPGDRERVVDVLVR